MKTKRRQQAGFLQVPELTIDGREELTRFLRRKRFVRTVKLQGYLVFYSEVLGREIVVPESFVSDGASVPRLLWALFPPFGRYLEAAIIHDWLCVEGKAGRGRCNSAQAHAVFREVMKVQGIWWPKRWTMWSAVRAFGPRWKATK